MMGRSLEILKRGCKDISNSQQTDAKKNKQRSCCQKLSFKNSNSDGTKFILELKIKNFLQLPFGQTDLYMKKFGLLCFQGKGNNLLLC